MANYGSSFKWGQSSAPRPCKLKLHTGTNMVLGNYEKARFIFGDIFVVKLNSANK